jgi:hypothetical protein
LRSIASFDLYKGKLYVVGVFADGSRVPGAISPQQLEQKLAEIN